MQPSEQKTDLRRIGRLFGPHRARLTAVLGLILVSAALGMVTPFLLREVLDTAIPERDTGLLVAHAAGLTDVLLPERNRGDVDDVPADVREKMTFHPVMTVGEVLDVALEPALKAARA